MRSYGAEWTDALQRNGKEENDGEFSWREGHRRVMLGKTKEMEGDEENCCGRCIHGVTGGQEDKQRGALGRFWTTVSSGRGRGGVRSSRCPSLSACLDFATLVFCFLSSTAASQCRA